MRSRLAQQLSLPRRYADFLRTVQQLSSKTAAPPYQTTPKLASDPMDVSELTIGALTFDSPAPAQSTSKELRQLYRQTGRCVRCGSQEHYIKNCNLAPAYTTPSTSGKRVTITTVNDDDSGTYSDLDEDSDADGVSVDEYFRAYPEIN